MFAGFPLHLLQGLALLLPPTTTASKPLRPLTWVTETLLL